MAAAACGDLQPAPDSPEAPVLFAGATVVDGTGGPAVRVNVRVQGGVIEAVGALDARPGDRVFHAEGLILAPGFIDTHSHHDRGLLSEPTALAAVSQGITTIVVGQDGGSLFPLAAFFDSLAASPAAVNVASYVGHGTLRREVMGADYARQATPAETRAMANLLAGEMQSGALGLSTGLEYDPGIYSSTDEVLALARVVHEHGGRYISHMRSEDRALWDALAELILIGESVGLPVQVSHAKLAMKSLWGEAPRFLGALDSARARGVDVTADVYPYPYWQSTMTVLFPDRVYTPAAARFALDELAPPEGFLIARYGPDPSLEGRTLAEVAAERSEDPAATYLALIEASVRASERGEDGDESIIATSMAEADIDALLSWPHTNVSSDGALRGGHPRGFGAFTRILADQVRDRRVMSVETAVHKMTGLSADHMGITGRGRIAPGQAADLVLLDPRTVADRATPEATPRHIHRNRGRVGERCASVRRRHPDRGLAWQGREEAGPNQLIIYRSGTTPPRNPRRSIHVR